MNTGVDKMSPVEFQQRQNAVRSLPLIRYNYATGEDAMPDLIKASVNGTFSEELKNVVQFMGFPSSKAGAQETLHAIASGLTVAHIPGNGGISSGFSDERQKMLEQQMAAIDNPHIPVETRLRAWTDGAKPRLMEQAGPAYAGAYKPPVPGAPINTTPTKSSKSINFNDLK
jgi:hypothetical protein